MRKIDKKLIVRGTLIFIIFIFYRSAGAESLCSPIGQLAQLANFKSHSVVFLEVAGTPVVHSADINTPTCLKNKAAMSEQSFLRAQMMDASAQEAFVIVKTIRTSIPINCLIDVYNTQDMSNTSWKTLTDECFANPTHLLQVSSGVSDFKFYVNSLQAKILNTRTPSSLKNEKAAKK